MTRTEAERPIWAKGKPWCVVCQADPPLYRCIRCQQDFCYPTHWTGHSRRGCPKASK